MGSTRMVAASLAFAAHAKISACDSLAEAYARAGVKGTRSILPVETPPSRGDR